MAYLSWFCMLVGAFFIFLGYMITFKRNIIVYEGSYPEGILSSESHEVIGSNLMLLGIISGSTGFTELFIPEFKGRLFYFLILATLFLAYKIWRQRD